MPELPEVETVVRGLRRIILNRKIKAVKINPPRIARPYFSGPIKKLVGCTIIDIKRRGKNILIDFDHNHTLWVHLKMTGHFYYLPKETPTDKHDHFIVDFFDDSHTLRFNDYRRFGYMRLIPTDDLYQQKDLKELGPEPLEISPSDFIDRFRSSQRMIKPALLDQTFLAGLGNIYVDESLYRAGINPRKRTDKIPARKLVELHGIIRSLLREAIKKMGTSVDSFAGVDGRPGEFQKYLKVYGREGEKCKNCGTIIRRIKIGSRSTHYCPRCQKS
jgi:formamidopyrimidine-DNA glycosylase